MVNQTSAVSGQVATLTMGSAFEHAKAAADRLEAALGTSKTPDLDRACMHIHHAFDAGMQALFSADSETPLSLIDLANCFAVVHEHRARVLAQETARVFKVWIGLPGQTFGHLSGNSAREVVIATIHSIHSALQATLGCSTRQGQYPPAVLNLRISGEVKVLELAAWPDRAMKTLRFKAFPQAKRCERERDSDALWSCFLDELQRTREFILHLRSLDWYSLAVYGSRAVTNWVDEPEYRDSVRTLASRLRTAARTAGVCDQTADDERVYQNVLDWLVAKLGCTVSAANALPVAKAIDRLESQPNSQVNRPSLIAELRVDEANRRIDFGGRSEHFGGDVAWRAFVRLYKAHPDPVNLHDMAGRSAKDIADDVRRMLRSRKFDALAERIKSVRNHGHAFI